jgi:transcription elongation factor B subunit 1
LDTKRGGIEKNTPKKTNHPHSAIVLEKVVEYFHYWYRYRDKEDVPDMDIPVELCLELLMAAEFFAIDARPEAMRDMV